MSANAHVSLRRRERAGDMRDLLVALLCCAAIAVTAYSLYLDETTPLEAGDAAPAGIVDYREGATHRRYATRAIWEKLSPGDVVYNRNSIRTGPAAEALIRLFDDTRIELDQATMVVLELRENEIRLRLEAGSVEIRRSQPRYARELNVSRGDHILEFDSGQVRLEALPENGLQVTPHMGSVTVRESSRQISAGDRMRLSGTSERESLRVHLLEPEQGERLPDDRPIILRWKHAPAGVAAEANDAPDTATMIEISSDAAFQQIVERRQLLAQKTRSKVGSANSTITRLPPGRYYWRVRSRGDTSAISKFRVLDTKSGARELAIIEPKVTELSLPGTPGDANRALVPFAWQAVDSDARNRYRLEIYSGALNASPTTAQPILIRSVEREYIRVPLPAGEYHFRVRSSQHASPARRLRLKLANATQTSGAEHAIRGPELSTESNQQITASGKPAPNTAISTVAARERVRTGPASLRLSFPYSNQSVDMSTRDALVFRWQSLPDAGNQPEYRLRLYALDGGVPRLIHSGTSGATSLRFDRLHLLEEAGRYRWTLSAADGREATADFQIVLSETLAEPEFVTEPTAPSTTSEPTASSGGDRL